MFVNPFFFGLKNTHQIISECGNQTQEKKKKKNQKQPQKKKKNSKNVRTILVLELKGFKNQNKRL